MMKTMIKKLKNKKGESLSEVLVASLFVSLAFVMILGMIMASQKMIQKTETTMKQYYANRNAFEEGTTSSTATGTITISGTSKDAPNQTTITDSINVNVTTQEVTVGSDTQDYVSYERAGS